MKKVLLGLSLVLVLASCSSAIKKETLSQKYTINKEAARNWEETINGVIISESEIPDWFGEENPLLNLRKNGRLTERDLYFLEELGKLQANQITDEDYNKFLEILTRYVNGLPRRFVLEDTNIKDPKGLVDYMVKAANAKVDNPSKYIKEVVADEHEWSKIVELSKKNDLNEKDVKKLRKLLNTFIKRDNFFNPSTWLNQEISDRVLQLRELDKREVKSKNTLNNINAKALYIAYPGFFSKLDKWSR